MFYIPRINIVNGITQEHITKWGWNVNEKGWVNFPDVQGRLYQKKQSMFWNGKVHEAVQGFESYSIFPQDEVFCIKHIKEIERQEKQNALFLLEELDLKSKSDIYIAYSKENKERRNIY